MQKEKVINSRISKDIYDKIAKLAEKQRVTISNFIRNIIEDSLEATDVIAHAVDNKIRQVLDKEPEVVGFQTIELEKDTVCDKCGKQIAKNSAAYLGISKSGSARLLICAECRSGKKQKNRKSESV